MYRLRLLGHLHWIEDHGPAVSGRRNSKTDDWINLLQEAKNEQ